MSAFTSAKYFLQGKPPVVTTGSLAMFLEGVEALDVLQPSKYLRAELKFGQAIDQDDEPIYQEEQISAYSFLMKDTDWDAQLSGATLQEVIAWLRSPLKRRGLFTRPKTDQCVYRALLDLGMLKEEIYRDFTHQTTDERGNEYYLNLSELRLWIDPVILHEPEEPEMFHVGYMSLDISGNGYLFPWTYEETLARVQGSEALQRLTDLCRSCWPGSMTLPTPEVIAGRRRMGKLWGDDVEAPADWRWAINESF